jgi:hypothetical protein
VPDIIANFAEPRNNRSSDCKKPSDDSGGPSWQHSFGRAIRTGGLEVPSFFGFSAARQTGFRRRTGTA